jgi:hypothetical protein
VHAGAAKVSPGDRSPASKDTSSFRPRLDPLQSSSSPHDRPVLGPGRTSLGFRDPSTASTSEPHIEVGRPIPTSVPLSGFLNLSAVSRQTRVPRPYFVPQPFLGFLLQSFPSRQVRTPLDDRDSLAVIHRHVERTPRPLVAPGFPDSCAETQLPKTLSRGSPGCYELPFRRTSRLPGHSGGRTAKPPRLPASPTSEPSSSRLRPNDQSKPWTPDRSSPGVLPL